VGHAKEGWVGVFGVVNGAAITVSFATDRANSPPFSTRDKRIHKKEN